MHVLDYILSHMMIYCMYEGCPAKKFTTLMSPFPTRLLKNLIPVVIVYRIRVYHFLAK